MRRFAALAVFIPVVIGLVIATTTPPTARATNRAAQCIQTAHAPSRPDNVDGSTGQWATGISDEWCTAGTQYMAVWTELQTFNRTKWAWKRAAGDPSHKSVRREPGGLSEREWSHCDRGYGRWRDRRAWGTVGHFTFCRYENGLNMKCYFTTKTARTTLECVHAT